jgi:hypothetical protein
MAAVGSIFGVGTAGALRLAAAVGLIGADAGPAHALKLAASKHRLLKMMME